MDYIRSTRYYYYKGLRILKRQGLIALIGIILKKFRYLLLLTNSADWYARDIRKPLPNIMPQCHVRIIFDSRDKTVEWLREHHQSFSWMYIPQEIETALLEGHVFPHLRFNGEIVGYVKLGFNGVYILDYDEIIVFPVNQCFIYDTFIMPEFRGKNLATFLLSEIVKWLRYQDVEKLWCHIPSWNISSRKTFEKLGFQRVAHVRYLRVVGMKVLSKDPRTFLETKHLAFFKDDQQAKLY